MNATIRTLLLALLLSSCAGEERPLEGEYIYRKSGERFFALEPPQHQMRDLYPWEQSYAKEYPRITEEFFRCKGCSSNPVRLIAEGERRLRLSDCETHGLPYITPILIELLNYLQEQTGNRVVITCGHRCPTHNKYSDPRTFNQASKHMIGAEVDFYIQGMEEEPEQIVALLEQFYLEQPRGADGSLAFERYYKENTDVATPPWYNREIFVKLYTKEEGRDADNRHPYPYIGIQVRRDYTSDQPVVYSWERATQFFRD